MAKTIYTDRDIDDLAQRGVKEIAVTDEVYVTDLARERAERLGVVLRTAAPSKSAPEQLAPPFDNRDQLVSQVKADVIAKLGSQVDAEIIERIVRRVVSQLK